MIRQQRSMRSIGKEIYREQLPAGLLGTSTPLPVDYPLQTWDDALNDGHYDVLLNTPQNGLPAGIWYIEVQRHSNDVLGNQYRTMRASSFGVGNTVNAEYKATCSNGVWTPFRRQAADEPLNWNYPTLLNSWVNLAGYNSPARYAKDSMGNVHIAGFISGGSNAVSSVAFILPSGFRQQYDSSVSSATLGGAVPIDFEPTGNVLIVASSGTGNPNGWVALSTVIKAV